MRARYGGLSASWLGMIGAIGVAVSAVHAETVPLSTPPDITLIDVSEIISNALPQYLWRRLGDADGKPLYTYDADAPGNSHCYDACAKEFPPLLADRHAVAFGDWSLVSRGQSAKQWAYQGKPLYRYAGKDPAGEPVGDREVVVNPGWADPTSKFYSPKAGWRRAAFTPEKTLAFPSTVELQSLPVANGFGFIETATGMTVYAVAPSRKMPRAWKPLYASALALPIGQFSIVASKVDGSRTWSYQGKLLYTYAGDLAAGEVNGIFADKRVQAALAYRNFLPAAIRIAQFPQRGPLLTSTRDLTVYTQARYHLQYGARETRTGYLVSYSNAKSLGALGCVSDCTKIWHPVTAPNNARSSGFWEVATRADGTKQWAYKGSPIYTYFGDRRPGDIEGNNRHDVIYGDAQGGPLQFAGAAPFSLQHVSMSVAAGGSGDDRQSGSGFYWHIAVLNY